MFRKTNNSVAPPTVLDKQGRPVERPAPVSKASRLPGDESSGPSPKTLDRKAAD